MVNRAACLLDTAKRSAVAYPEETDVDSIILVQKFVQLPQCYCICVGDARIDDTPAP